MANVPIRRRVQVIAHEVDPDRPTRTKRVYTSEPSGDERLSYGGVEYPADKDGWFYVPVPVAADLLRLPLWESRPYEAKVEDDPKEEVPDTPKRKAVAKKQS